MHRVSHPAESWSGIKIAQVHAMSNNFQQVHQDALRISPDEQMRLREALEDAEGNLPSSILPPRVAGLNKNDPRVLQDPESPLPAEYPSELP
jgi:hypothetical protein